MVCDYDIGTVFRNKVGDECFIINVENSKQVTVMFYDGYYTTTQMSNVRKGSVKNPFSKRSRFHGFGVTDVPAMVNGTRNKYARLWESMISRVYSGKDKAYDGVTIDEDWALLSNFLKDVTSFKGCNKVISDGWVLDKDILSGDEKVYSKNTCCFVPPEINSFMVSFGKPKGKYKMGVHFCNREKKFVSQGYKNKKQVCLGYFNNEDDAHSAYIENKREQLQHLLSKWKDDLDDKVIESLISKFNIGNGNSLVRVVN